VVHWQLPVTVAVTLFVFVLATVVAANIGSEKSETARVAIAILTERFI
jgi:hypothetical protein